MANKKEQGFNDAELQDIMSEIENLEREYEGDKPETVEAKLDPIAEEMLAHEQETNAEAEHEEIETEIEAEVVSEVVKEDNVVNLTPKTTTTGGHQVEFHGAGQVNFSLNFDIAGQTAHLEVSEEGLVVSLDGMHLSVDETNGCTIEMEGGVKFSVPMGGQSKVKKAA